MLSTVVSLISWLILSLDPEIFFQVLFLSFLWKNKRSAILVPFFSFMFSYHKYVYGFKLVLEALFNNPRQGALKLIKNVTIHHSLTLGFYLWLQSCFSSSDYNFDWKPFDSIIHKALRKISCHGSVMLLMRLVLTGSCLFSFCWPISFSIQFFH